MLGTFHGMSGCVRLLLHLLGDLIGDLLSHLEVGRTIEQRTGKCPRIYDKSIGRFEFMPIKRRFYSTIHRRR